MTKYNFEFKKKVVLEYINENISIRSLAKKHAIKGGGGGYKTKFP